MHIAHLVDRGSIAQLTAELAIAAERLMSALRTATALPAPVNDNETADVVERSLPDDPMTLREVQHEFRLREKQIVLLRRLWGFPNPRQHRQGRLIFSRREVQDWAEQQPNQANLAAVLRLRRRRLPKDELE